LLKTVAADALQKMEVEVADTVPETTSPDLPLDAPIVDHAKLCAWAVWNVLQMHPIQHKAIGTLFNKSNKEKKDEGGEVPHHQTSWNPAS
jgi:hypothetical protein